MGTCTVVTHWFFVATLSGLIVLAILPTAVIANLVIFMGALYLLKEPL